MSPELAHPTPRPGRVGRWLAGREGLSWLISVLAHTAVIAMASFICIVVIPPPTRRHYGPVRLENLSQEKLTVGRLLLSKAVKFETAAPRKRPDAPAWARLTSASAITRRGDTADGKTRKRIPIGIPGGGPEDKPRPPRWPDDEKGIIPRRLPMARPTGEARIVYVLDGSGSMLHGLDAVKRRLIVDLSRLEYDERTGRGHHFSIIFFREGAEAFWPGLLPATNANKIRAARWLRKVRAVGGTNPVPAMKMAFAHRADFIVVLSDGEFGKKVLDVVRRLQTGRQNPAKIIAVAYGKEFPAKALADLASRNGGRFIRLRED